MIREPGGEFTQHGKQSRPSKEKGMIINNKCHRKASTAKPEANALRIPHGCHSGHLPDHFLWMGKTEPDYGGA